MQALRPPENSEQVRFPATLQGLDALHNALERFWRLCDAVPYAPPQGVWRYMFVIAVGEIAGNIVRHAYAGTPGGAIELRLRLFDDHVVARFVDHGGTYMPRPSANDATVSTDDSDQAEDGRGLQVAAVALDSLHYRRTTGGVNIWRLVKRMPDS